MGTRTTPGIPMDTNGTCGKLLPKRNPEVLGRKPGTLTAGTGDSDLLVELQRGAFSSTPSPDGGLRVDPSLVPELPPDLGRAGAHLVHLRSQPVHHRGIAAPDGRLDGTAERGVSRTCNAVAFGRLAVPQERLDAGQDGGDDAHDTDDDPRGLAGTSTHGGERARADEGGQRH